MCAGDDDPGRGMLRHVAQGPGIRQGLQCARGRILARQGEIEAPAHAAGHDAGGGLAVHKPATLYCSVSQQGLFSNMIETPTVETLETKTGFLKDICAYFRDFLDTDFKRQSAPKRNITLKDPAGNLTGIDGAKYPELAGEVWRLLRKPIDDNSAFSLAVPRGRYRGRLRTALKELIEKHAEALR